MKPERRIQVYRASEMHSFIGWIILGLITFGIGFFLIAPYIETTFAHYYEDLKKEQGE